MKRGKMMASWQLVLVMGLLAGCSSQEESATAIGFQSNSECEQNTRGWSAAGNPILKLTRDGNNILGELQNYEVPCIYDGLKVTCEAENSMLNINVSDLESTACECYINIYFTIFNAKEDTYQLSLNGKPLGTASFLEHKVVQIDLENLEQANEEGFEYPVKSLLNGVYDRTSYPNPTSSPSLQIGFGAQSDKAIWNFSNYDMPCDEAKYDVTVEQVRDGILVIDLLCDRMRDPDCKRLGDYMFTIVNLKQQPYHFKLNHVYSGFDSEGKSMKETILICEGDFEPKADSSVKIQLEAE